MTPHFPSRHSPREPIISPLPDPTLSRTELHYSALSPICAQLRKTSMTVLDPAWRWDKHHVGIVFLDHRTLCFLATVTRCTEVPHEPEFPLSARQKLRISAGQWLCSHRAQLLVHAIRFDLMQVNPSHDPTVTFHHLPGAA